MSPPTRVVWIEINFATNNDKVTVSPPTRVVWIEIGLVMGFFNGSPVTTHTGGVD